MKKLKQSRYAFMGKGFLLVAEALVALTIAVLLIDALSISPKSNQSAIYDHQLTQDIFEALEINGSAKHIGGFADGDPYSTQHLHEIVEEIAKDLNACIIISSERYSISANCGSILQSNHIKSKITSTRIIAKKGGYEKMSISLVR
ncbi:MAG: hypothetical protein QXP42_02980 [Candidatus Micrarchaeia archaeon]